MNSQVAIDKWDEEISDEEADLLLEQHFYPFKKVSCIVVTFCFRGQHKYSCTDNCS